MFSKLLVASFFALGLATMSGCAAGAAEDADASGEAVTAGDKPTFSVTLRINGEPMTVHRVYASKYQSGLENLVIQVSGEGVREGTEVIIHAYGAGGGCGGDAHRSTATFSSNTVWYNAIDAKGNDEGTRYPSSGDSACSLNIGSYPAANKARFTGSFHGTVDSGWLFASKTKIDLDFDTPGGFVWQESGDSAYL